MIGTSAPNVAAITRAHSATQNPVPRAGAVKRLVTGNARPPVEAASPLETTALGTRLAITRCSSPAGAACDRRLNDPLYPGGAALWKRSAAAAQRPPPFDI